MTSNDDDTPPSRLKWLLGLVLFLSVPLALIWWPGCREYPAATSPEALESLRLLYTACNTKDTARLAKVERDIARLTQQGKLTPSEQQAFAAVIAQAKSGNWADAERAAFKFIEDQVGQGTGESEPYQRPTRKR